MNNAGLESPAANSKRVSRALGRLIRPPRKDAFGFWVARQQHTSLTHKGSNIGMNHGETVIVAATGKKLPV